MVISLNLLQISDKQTNSYYLTWWVSVWHESLDKNEYWKRKSHTLSIQLSSLNEVTTLIDIARDQGSFQFPP